MIESIAKKMYLENEADVTQLADTHTHNTRGRLEEF